MQVADERGGEADRLVRADGVVDGQVAGDPLGQHQPVADLVAVQVLVYRSSYLIAWKNRSMTPLVWGERWRVRTWANSGRLAMKRAKLADR